jgi:hypothetical protein
MSLQEEKIKTYVHTDRRPREDKERKWPSQEINPANTLIIGFWAPGI